MRRNNNNHSSSGAYRYQPLRTAPSQSAGISSSGSGSSGSMYNRDVLEEQNERAAEQLKEKIGTLKSLTIDIGNEVRYQEKLLRGIDDDMDRTQGFLSNTMNRVLRLGERGPRRQMCYMIVFVFIVFLLMYLIIKLK